MKDSSSILWILNTQMMAIAFAQIPIQINVDLSKARLHLVVSSTSVIPEENIQPLGQSESIRNYATLYRQNLRIWAFSSVGSCKQKLCNLEVNLP